VRGLSLHCVIYLVNLTVYILVFTHRWVASLHLMKVA
jgi:hypothetical protein